MNVFIWSTQAKERLQRAARESEARKKLAHGHGVPAAAGAMYGGQYSSAMGSVIYVIYFYL